MSASGLSKRNRGGSYHIFRTIREALLSGKRNDHLASGPQPPTRLSYSLPWSLRTNAIQTDVASHVISERKYYTKLAY
jgi:hypothetical protein